MEDNKRRKIGIIGGTFNPVHIGHLLLAEWAKEAQGLDEILFIPTGCSYIKQQCSVLAGSERMKMVELAIQDRSDFFCCDIEINRPGNTYTYETLEMLHINNPGAEYFFLMGADCLFAIESWKCPDRIFNSCTIIAALRDGNSLPQMQAKCLQLEKRFHGKIELLPFISLGISSSEIRKRVAAGHSVRYLIPDTVLDYINLKHFYQ